MKNKASIFSPGQLAFQELFISTFIYATVLGFFNDYTTIVEAKSFSTIFFASIVLEVLTFLTFKLKERIVVWLKQKNGAVFTALRFFCVWLIMFLSKFVFVYIIDLIFGNYISIHGFFGILAVVLSVTIIHRLAYLLFWRLGDSTD